MIDIAACKLSEGNWGDDISRNIAEWISGDEVRVTSPVETHEYPERIFHTTTGSILGWLKPENVNIWGVGFIKTRNKFTGKPLSIKAVRGPLSRNMLLAYGYECPAVYGDPALLIPKYYNPTVKVQYKLGVIPHSVDQKSKFLDIFKDRSDIKIIDITHGKNCDNNLRFIREVLSCEKIISSSLHGVVIGDAYGIPSRWIELSNNVHGYGFKFRDYLLSVGRDVEDRLIFDKGITVKKIMSGFKAYKIKIDLDKLLEACPYK